MLMLTAISICLLVVVNGNLGAKSKFIDRGTDQFVPMTVVLGIDHKSQESELGDTPIPGEEWDPRVYRIRTPLEVGSRVMYRYNLLGYSYGVGRPMDCLWVGYLYDNPSGPPIQKYETCVHPSGVKASTYIEGGYLYLKLGPISRFCNAFELHYQGHFMNATLGLQHENYDVMATK